MKALLQRGLLVLDYVNLVLFIALIVVATLQVVFRYALRVPLPWTEELARFLLVWVTFLGAASITRRKMHIQVDYFTNRFNPAAKTLLRAFIYLLMTGFLGVLLWGIGVMIIDSWPVHAGTMPGLSMSFVYLGAFFGVLMILGFVGVQFWDAAVSAMRKSWTANSDREI